MSVNISHLRDMLAQARADKTAAREELRLSRSREKALRAEVARLTHRLNDFGALAEPVQGTRRGYRTVNSQFRAQILALNAEGMNYSQISRRLGCSVATASLVCRGKYPGAAA